MNAKEMTPEEFAALDPEKQAELLGLDDAEEFIHGEMQRAVPSNAFQAAITLCHTKDRDSVARRDLLAAPQSIFRGEGLWLWGTDESTLVHNIKAGNQNCFSISHTAIPGLYFEAGIPFSEFEKLIEKRPGEWSHERLRELPPMKAHQHIRMLTVEIGNSIVLDVEGPITHAVMWGLTVL